MGDDFRRGDGKHRHLAYRQPLTQLKQPRFPDEIGRARLAQEIDVEIGGDREFDMAKLRENRDIEGDVGQRENGRTGNRAAGAQLFGAVVKPQPRAHRPDGLDAEISSDPNLRELLREIGGDGFRIESKRR
jgi:hypothetical protein